jgi:signal transduction histidine kinase
MQTRQEPSAGVRAVATFAVVLVITGAVLAWALVTASHAAFAQVAVGGSAAAVVISLSVATAVYQFQAARRARLRASLREQQAHQMEREFTVLAQETMPLVGQRVRDGSSSPDEIFAGMPRPENDAVRGLLTTVQRLLSGVVEDATTARSEAEVTIAAARSEAKKSVLTAQNESKAALLTAQGDVAATAQREASAVADRERLEAEATALAEQTIPSVIGQLRAGEPKDMVMAEASHPDFAALDILFDSVVTEIGAAEGRGASAMAACANAAARVQAQTTRMLAELREMEQRYGDDKVFSDLMELDHRVSQMGRLADSIALLSGGRSGRRWTKPIPMESILRGAMGRIDSYQRVRVHSTSSSAIAGYAAEGVMHALAELMDNATSFSAHGSEVHVYVEEEDVGLVVTIEDSGLGMRRRERDRAEELVSQPLGLATLPGTRLGLAVVGRICARYGLNVNFRPSSRGGTGVVVMVPRPLVAPPKGSDIGAGRRWSPASDVEQGHAGELSGPPEEAPAALASAEPESDETGMENLPVRPRGRTLAESVRPPAAPVGQPADSEQRPASTAGARFAAFRKSGAARDTGPNAASEPLTSNDEEGSA